MMISTWSRLSRPRSFMKCASTVSFSGSILS
uniref:High affinity cationic amino acid transporter 1 n=1 Tax=Micrurus fulvius TaxID=8637 RepID=U3FXL7_MICFL